MTNYAIQEQNQDLVSLLAAHFRLLYNSSHAFSDATSMMMGLPGLRGFWPGNIIDSAGLMIDASGIGGHLTRNGTLSMSSGGTAGLRWSQDYNGTTDYHSHIDVANYDILGTEAYINGAIRGLTVGGWFLFDRDTNAEGLICKSDGNNANRNWDLLYRGDSVGDPAQFTVSSGASGFTATGATALTTATWYHIVGRYDPSTHVELWINGAIDGQNTTSIPASLNNSTAPLNIAARNGALFLDGRASLCFLCVAAIPDIHIKTIFQFTAPLFNVSV